MTAGTLGNLLSLRPRYLLHGVAVVAVAGIVGTIALQPRPAPEPTGPSISLSDSMVVSAPQTDDDSTDNQADASTDATPVADDGNSQAVAAATDAPAAPTAEPAKAATPTTYHVAEGETLAEVAQRFGVSTDTIIWANNITDPDLVDAGDTLTILPTDGVLYALHPGDTLVKVAARFGVTVPAILDANNLGANPDMVPEGTKIVIPGATPLPTPDVVQSSGTDQQAAAVGQGVPLAPSVATHQAPSTRNYEVQDGDTLNTIADKFGVDVATILSSNGIDDPDSIRPGSELTILPVKGIQYEVQPGETLADIAWKYQVDLGLLLDYNNLDNPDKITTGEKLVVPGGNLRADANTAPKPILAPVESVAPAAAPAAAAPAPKPAAVAPAPAPAPAVVKPAPAPAAPAPAPAPKPAVASSGSGGADIVATAMKYQGYRYVWGGTSPAGFDCSGFVYYVTNVTGHGVGRGMWQQFNGGTHVAISDLQPGDIVFFSNTYEPGLSHDGIYIGNGQFVHAADESVGVVVSSLWTSYWQSHYTGATRVW